VNSGRLVGFIKKADPSAFYPEQFEAFIINQERGKNYEQSS
jgi:hypothetical protein